MPPSLFQCQFNVISICLINKIQSWSQLFNKYRHLLLFRFSSSTFRVPRSQGSIFQTQTMSNVIDLTEEPYILYPRTLDLTGSHVIINGTIIILDTVLMIKEHSQKKVDLDIKAKRNQKNAALGDKNRLDKIIEQENKAKCLHNSQLTRLRTLISIIIAKNRINTSSNQRKTSNMISINFRSQLTIAKEFCVILLLGSLV